MTKASCAAYRRPIWIERREGRFADAMTGEPLEKARIGSGDLVLLLSSRDVLRRQQTFPRAGKSRLKEIVELEVTSDAPFVHDEIVWDHRAQASKAGLKTIDVETVIAKRDRVIEAARDFERQWNRKLTGVDCVASDGKSGLGINLLPEEFRRTRPPTLSKLNRTVAVACLIAALSASTAAGFGDAEGLDTLRARADAIRADAEAAINVREQFFEARSRLDQLASLRGEAPSHLSILNEVSSLLPDHSWVNEMEIDESGVSLKGQSASAIDLIALFEASLMFERARFSAPVVPDPKSDRDRFAIALDFKGGAAP